MTKRSIGGQATSVLGSRAWYLYWQAQVVGALLACSVACGSSGSPDSTTGAEHAAPHADGTASPAAKLDAAVAMPADGGKKSPASSANTARGNATPAADTSATTGTPDAYPGSTEPAGSTSKPDTGDAADDAGVTDATPTIDAGQPPSAGVGAGTGGTGGGGAGGVRGPQGAGGFGGGEAFCIHPPSCVAVFTPTVGLDTCCPNNGEPCGYSVAYPTELDDGTCRPNSEVYLKLPGQEEQRVTKPGAPDQLITPDCETRGVLAFNLPGCCMPDNRCGVSTYQMASILLGLAVVPAPFTSVECVRVETLNAQLRASLLAGMGQIPPSDGTCNYADLDARLPVVENEPAP